MGNYVSCLYQKEWCDGVNEEVSVEENNVLVKLLHPIDPPVYIFIGLQLRLNAGCQ